MAAAVAVGAAGRLRLWWAVAAYAPRSKVGMKIHWSIATGTVAASPFTSIVTELSKFRPDLGFAGIAWVCRYEHGWRGRSRFAGMILVYGHDLGLGV